MRPNGEDEKSLLCNCAAFKRIPLLTCVDTCCLCNNITIKIQ